MPLTRILESITRIVGRILLVLLLVTAILVVPRVGVVTSLVGGATVGMITLVVVDWLLVLEATMVGVTMVLVVKRFLRIVLLLMLLMIHR